MAELGGTLFGLNVDDDERLPEISVDMLDYDYVESCQDKKKLKGILELLKSGKEGSYPPLEKKCEEKLLSLLSDAERKRMHRLTNVPTPSEIHEAEEDLNKWQKSVEKRDEIIRSNKIGIDKSVGQNNTTSSVRGTVGTIPIEYKKKSATVEESSDKKEKPKRLSGYDFRAWEKFDVDAAVDSVDQEEVTKNTDDWKLKHNQQQPDANKTRNTYDSISQLRDDLNVESLSDSQKSYHAGTT